MENNNDFLRSELTEINSYARQHFQLLLTWYTFFLTVNFTVLGWFASQLLTKTMKTSLPIMYVAVFFLVQITLSFLACLDVRKYFRASHDRYGEILNILAHTADPNTKPKSALPLHSYTKILDLMGYTFASFGALWVALLVLAIRWVPL